MQRKPGQAISGANQGHNGMTQGYKGAVRGAAVGPYEGLQRSQQQTNPLGNGKPKMSQVLAKIAQALRARAQQPRRPM